MSPRTENHNIRMSPHDLDAERSLLGCQILDDKCVMAVSDLIQVSDYYSDLHQTVQQAIFDLQKQSIPADIMTVVDKLQGLNLNVNVAELVMGLMEAVPFSTHFAFYADIVKKKSHRRQAIEAANRLLESAYDVSLAEADLVDTASQKLSIITGEITKQNRKPISLKNHSLNLARKIGEGEKLTQFIGIDPIDTALGGVAWGENVAIGCLTGHGKTMIMLQWLHEAARHGFPSLVISKEMHGEGLATRSMRRISNIPINEWHKSNELLAVDIERHYENYADILIEENCISARDVEMSVEYAVREHGIRLVALDYVQLVEGDGQTKENKIADTSRRWKQLLLKHKLIGLLLCQFNREAIKHKKIPRMHDIRDTGAIAQDADIVLVGYWGWQEDKADKYEDYKIIVEKMRQREPTTKSIDLRIDAKAQWLHEIDAFEAADSF